MRNRTGGLAVMVALVMGWVAGVVMGAPPKVVKAVPDNGDVDVDPSITEIRVTFDQPMARSFSWVGGGETFPGAGQARWVDEKTCVMPVKLKPDKQYWIGINSPSHQNFRSKAGEPAVRYPIAFTTGAGKAAKPLTKEENAAAVARLRKHLAEDYAHLDTPVHRVDWEAAIEAAEGKLEGARTKSEFARELAKVLEKAKDIHIRVGVGEMVMGTAGRTHRANYNRRALMKAVTNYQDHGGRVATGTVGEGIGYVLITGWDEEAQKQLAAAYAIMPLCKALVVDVRPNGGGGEDIAREFAGCFITEPKGYAKDVIKEGGKFSEVLTRVVRPNEKRPHFAGKVVVLQGDANVSSNESFVMMMKAAGATTVGAKTGGSSGRPVPHELGNGVTVYLPSWKDLRMDGTGIEGEGLVPDVEVTDYDFSGRDPVLERALEVVKK